MSTSTWLASGASAGMTTVARTPAAAAYAASAPPALPAEGTTTCFAPSSIARLTATAIPRALKDPVGLRLSRLTRSFDRPSHDAVRGAACRGVLPSPRWSTDSHRRTGSTSRQRHGPPYVRDAIAVRFSVRAARSRS